MVDSRIAAPSTPPRVVLINVLDLEASYRATLNELARIVDLVVVGPNRYPYPYGQYRSDPRATREYRLRTYSPTFPAGVRTSTRWILRTLDLGFRDAPPDIIHVENEIHSFPVLQALFCRRRYAPRAKIVVSQWGNQRPRGPVAWGLLHLGRAVARRLDFVVSANEAGRRLLLEDGVTEDRIAIFPPGGVDTSLFAPATLAGRRVIRHELGLPDDAFVIGFAGRLVAEKGIHDLIEAFGGVRRSLEPRASRLLCVGDGPLKQHLQQSGPDVMVASPGGGGAVLKYYQAMDVLVLPSRTEPAWSEQFGRVLIEAMACGVPVVGSSSGAIPEVIGPAGIICAERRPEELARQLTLLAGDASKRAQLAEAGLERVHHHYSAAVIARKTAAVYREVLAARPRE